LYGVVFSAAAVISSALLVSVRRAFINNTSLLLIPQLLLFFRRPSNVNRRNLTFEYFRLVFIISLHKKTDIRNVPFLIVTLFLRKIMSTRLFARGVISESSYEYFFVFCIVITSSYSVIFDVIIIVCFLVLLLLTDWTITIGVVTM
jgi:hypothetical protein